MTPPLWHQTENIWWCHLDPSILTIFILKIKQPIDRLIQSEIIVAGSPTSLSAVWTETLKPSQQLWWHTIFFFSLFVVTPPLIVLLCFLCNSLQPPLSVMSGQAGSYYRPENVQQQMVDHRGDKGRGGGERAADHEAQLCSESFMSLSSPRSTRKTFSCNKPL